MSDKLTCPSCGSHTSAIYAAVEDGSPCPHCGLSAAAILEVLGANLDPASYRSPYEHREWP